MQGRKRDTEDGWWARGWGRGVGWTERLHGSIITACAKQTAGGKLLFIAGSSAPRSVMTQMGGVRGAAGGGPKGKGSMDTYS